MNIDWLEVTIGGLGLILSLWASGVLPVARGRAARIFPGSPRIAVFAAGIAVTSLILSGLNFVWSNQAVRVTEARVVVRTPRPPDSMPTNYPTYMAHRVGDPRKSHRLEMRCDPGFAPLAIWSEIIHEYDAFNVFKAINTTLENGVPSIVAEARWSFRSSYAIVDVILLCGRAGQD